MKAYYFTSTDPRTSKPFTMVVIGVDYTTAKQECLTWLRRRQRDDIAEMIEKSEKRVVRVIFPNTPCVLYSDVSWSVSAPEKMLDSMIYVYGDDEIHIDSPNQVRIWPDSHEVVEATKEITKWQQRNNFQYFEATKPEAVIEWLRANAKLKES